MTCQEAPVVADGVTWVRAQVWTSRPGEVRVVWLYMFDRKISLFHSYRNTPHHDPPPLTKIHRVLALSCVTLTYRCFNPSMNQVTYVRGDTILVLHETYQTQDIGNI